MNLYLHQTPVHGSLQTHFSVRESLYSGIKLDNNYRLNVIFNAYMGG